MSIQIIAFDADDTLWHNEPIYHKTQEKFKRLLSRYISTNHLEQQLFETETRNLAYFGYGIKSFTLSMIQTAAELTSGCIDGEDILCIIDYAREMLDTRLELLSHVLPTIQSLSDQYSLMIITKGDLLDQSRKLSRSGLESYFHWVEVVVDKTTEMYSRLFQVHKIDPPSFVMVGNSLRSDILPVTQLGAHAVYIPYQFTWAHENEIEHLPNAYPYHQIQDLSELPGLISRLEQTR